MFGSVEIRAVLLALRVSQTGNGVSIAGNGFRYLHSLFKRTSGISPVVP